MQAPKYLRIYQHHVYTVDMIFCEGSLESSDMVNKVQLLEAIPDEDDQFFLR
jgi:hypothetical protein